MNENTKNHRKCSFFAAANLSLHRNLLQRYINVGTTWLNDSAWTVALFCKSKSYYDRKMLRK